MRIGIAADHGGFGLKKDLHKRLVAAGHEVVDFGSDTLNSGNDYPDFVVTLARAVAADRVERGVADCGSGVGASICANKVPGVRAALVSAATESVVFEPLRATLLTNGDHYMHLADLRSYLGADQRLRGTYGDPETWGRKAILNVAGSGKFSSNRTIAEYATEIWEVKPCPVL